MGNAIPTAPPKNGITQNLWECLRFFKVVDSKTPLTVQAATPAIAGENPPPSSLLTWKKLATEAQEVETEFKTLLAQLEKKGVKRSLATAQGLDNTRDEIKKAIAVVNAVNQAATALETAAEGEETEKLKTLAAKMGELSAHATALKKQIPAQKNPNALLDIVTYLSPLVGGIWYLLIQVKILAASSPLVVGIAFIGWMWLTLVNVKQRIENRIIKIKAEDREQVIKHYGSLIDTFDGVKEKMNISDIKELRYSTMSDLSELRSSSATHMQQMAELKQMMQQLMQKNTEGTAKETSEGTLGNVPLKEIEAVSQEEATKNKPLYLKLQKIKELADQKATHEEISKLAAEMLAILKPPPEVKVEIV